MSTGAFWSCLLKTTWSRTRKSPRLILAMHSSASPLRICILEEKAIAMCVNKPLGEQKLRFRQDCRVFLIQLCSQMKKRFPFQSDGVLAMLSALNPKEALSTDRSLTSIIQHAVHTWKRSGWARRPMGRNIVCQGYPHYHEYFSYSWILGWASSC